MKYSQQKRHVAEFLKIWFKNNLNNKYLWSKDVIGVVLKEELTKRGNWAKSAPKSDKDNLFDILRKEEMKKLFDPNPDDFE